MYIKTLLTGFAIMAWLSLMNPTAATSTMSASSTSIDFNTLLDGSLGFFPSTWLVSKAALLELNNADVEKRALTAPSASTELPSPEPSSLDRTPKENGAVMATFISGMLVPAFFNVKDNGMAGGICRSLMTSAGSMTAAVIGQEAAKDIYGNNSTNSQFEQGVIPGSFIGSVIGNGAGHALSRTLCKRILPEFGPWLKSVDGPKATTAKLLTEALPQILTKQLEGLGVQPARALSFATELTDTIKIADTMTLSDAFKFLEQQTVSTAAELATVSRPVLDAMAQLTSASVEALQDIAPSVPLPQPPTPNIPTVPEPIVPPSAPGVPAPPAPAPPAPGVPLPPLPVPQAPIASSSLSTIVGHISQANQVAQQVTGAMRVAEDLRAATDSLRNGAQKASDFVRQGLHEEAKAAFDGASSAAKSVVSDLFHLIPLPGSPEAHHTKHVTKTHWKTKTKTKTRTVPATREVEKTKYKYVTVTATSSVTKTTVATTTITASTTKTRMTTSTKTARTTEPKTKTVTTISTTSTTTQLVYGMPTNKPQSTAHCECSLGSCSIVGPNQPPGSHCACSLGSCSIVPDVPAGWTRIQGTRKPTPTPKPRPASHCDLHPWRQSDCPW
ncbi:hypothetical protein HBH52_104470 [Parastagonospora nodorum]|nr:hypothetical protein HBH52_104470 [Parastagonospora nodorum]